MDIKITKDNLDKKISTLELIKKLFESKVYDTVISH